jgi:hypothetical protein
MGDIPSWCRDIERETDELDEVARKLAYLLGPDSPVVNKLDWIAAHVSSLAKLIVREDEKQRQGALKDAE